MRKACRLIIAAVMVALFASGCASRRKVEQRAAVETVATSAEAVTEQEQVRAVSETTTETAAESIDSGRVVIERDTAGLPVAINWRRKVTGSAAAKVDRATDERRNVEQMAATENRSSEESRSSEQVSEPAKKDRRLRIMAVVIILFAWFMLWRQRTK